MVMTGQQCSCCLPLMWIGHKLLAQPPRPALGPMTSTGRHSRLWRTHRPEPLASVRRPANDAKLSSPCRTTKQRMRTSSGSSLERGEDKWGLRSRVAPPCQQWSHHRPLQHRVQARETSGIKPRRLYRRWKKTWWSLPSTRSRDGQGDAPLPHHSANQSCKYLYL